MHADLPTVITVGAPTVGPIVAILGGVHGDEYEGVIAANSLAQRLQTELIAGEVRIAAPAHPAAWQSCTRESPIDDVNLARVFPGQMHGTPTQQVAHAITEQVIRGADLLIDLHSGGTNFEMPFMCGFHGGHDRKGADSQRFAHAFAARFTWRHDGTPAPGRSLTAAFELDIPAIYVESQGGRSVRQSDLQGYLDGVRRVLHELGMLSNAPAPTWKSIQVCGDGNTDAGILSPVAGFMVTRVCTGDRVSRGDMIAEIIDQTNLGLAKISATHDGYVMLLRRDARVAAGDTVCIVAECVKS